MTRQPFLRPAAGGMESSKSSNKHRTQAQPQAAESTGNGTTKTVKFSEKFANNSKKKLKIKN
jgi:hypothetical protein